VGIRSRLTLGVRVDVEIGFEVVCSLLLVLNCLSSVVECLHMLEYPYPLELALLWDEIKSIKHGIRARLKIVI